MSEFKVDVITNKDGSYGPQVCGITSFMSSGLTLPSGPTEFRGGRGRGLIGGSYPSPEQQGIDFIEISTLSNSQDFGEMRDGHGWSACFGSSTRAIWAGGYTGSTSYATAIDYSIFSSGGGGYEFGELRTAVRMNCGASDSVRGLSFGGLKSPGSSNNLALDTINYINIASGGTDHDFGSSSLARRAGKATASSTRAVYFIGGYQYGAAATNVIEYVTIQTTGNAIDFGDTSSVNELQGAAGANATRAVIAGFFGGPSTPLPAPKNSAAIEFITIATTGNTQSFGDLTDDRHGGGVMTNSTRGVITGMWPGAASDIIDYITLQTTGNAVDFGDLRNTRYYADCISDTHGGLAK
jgi:hypothetical protein